MKVVILCGGQGTRLREETEFKPKPMVEVGGRPILWHVMKLYAWYGFNDFVLCLGYRGNMIREYFLNYHAMNSDFTVKLGCQQVQYHGNHDEQNFSVTLAETGENTMTGARLKRVGKYLDDDFFLLTYGDGIADVDIRKSIEFHRAHGKLATVTVVRPHSRFGVVHAGQSGIVEAFAEKPPSEGCNGHVPRVQAVERSVGEWRGSLEGSCSDRAGFRFSRATLAIEGQPGGRR